MRATEPGSRIRIGPKFIAHNLIDNGSNERPLVPFRFRTNRIQFRSQLLSLFGGERKANPRCLDPSFQERKRERDGHGSLPRGTSRSARLHDQAVIAGHHRV